MKCINCEHEIPKERLEAIPGTQYCVKCVPKNPRIGVTVWDKGVPILVVTDERNASEFKRFDKGDGRLGRLK